MHMENVKRFGFCRLVLTLSGKKVYCIRSIKKVTSQVAPLILEVQKQDRIIGFHFSNSGLSTSINHQFGDLTAHMDRIHSYGKRQIGFGLILQTGPEGF